MVDDNFHYMDEESRYKHGEFSTYEKAVAACKKIVDEDLRDMLKQGVKPEELSPTWSLYGSDPYIVGGSRRFSARDYVTEKIQLSEKGGEVSRKYGLAIFLAVLAIVLFFFFGG